MVAEIEMRIEMLKSPFDEVWWAHVLDCPEATACAEDWEEAVAIAQDLVIFFITQGKWTPVQIRWVFVTSFVHHSVAKTWLA